MTAELPCPAWCVDHLDPDPREVDDWPEHRGAIAEVPIDHSGRVHLPGKLALQLRGADHDAGREVMVELNIGPTAFPGIVHLRPTESVRLAVALLTEALPALETDGIDPSVLAALTAITQQVEACADQL